MATESLVIDLKESGQLLLNELRGRLRNVREDLTLSHIEEERTGRTLIGSGRWLAIISR